MKGGNHSYRNKWPSPYAVVCGVLLLLSFLKYIYVPFKWLALGSVAVGSIPLILKAIASLRNLRIDINILMLIAVGGSIFLKDYWEAGTIVFLLTVSEWLETRASHKATAVMSSLMSIAPQNAVLADTGEEVDTKEVMVNTRLAVKAGTMIPIDGIVVEGNCEVDEKALTGESFPVSKQVDSIVWAGTINLNGYITVKTTALADDCVVAKMAKLVEEAQNNKSNTQRYVDKIAKYYTPVVCLVAACLAGIPAALHVHDVENWYHLALHFCAMSKAATFGLLVKGAQYLETLSAVKFICFDKTGTITKGEFSVSNFHPLIDNHKLLYWVSSLESKSSHPMAATLIDYARDHSVEPQPNNVEDFKEFPGEGIYGKIDGKDIYIGNQKIASRAGCSQVAAKKGSENIEGKSTGYIFVESTLAGIFSFSDSCRIGVKEALEELKSLGIRTAMLTGDCQAAANHAQNQLGGALEVVHAELLPQDKAKLIKEMQKEFKTAMVGDGLNDAPALATADIGISMGVSGSALANETGHIILMSNDIRKIPVVVRLARKTRRKIFENICFSITTKAAIIALAIAGHPLVWAAVLADVGTCLLVIFNSMLLLHGTTVMRSVETHSGSSLNHAQCSSGTKVLKNGGCCGQDDNVQELKHLVQETKEDDCCCARDDDHRIPKRDDTDGCCGRDDPTDATNCIPEAKGDCCANDVKHVVQSGKGKEKQGCCSKYDDDEIHEVQPQHKAKQLVQKTKCCNVRKDVESQGLRDSFDQDKPHCHAIVNAKKDDNHCRDRVKEYVTGEELGKEMKICCRRNGLKKRYVSGCCKKFISNKCCGAKYFAGGLIRKVYLSEIVIE
ncbi:hypothetical protein QVD17_26612 [Tagetes erecta]|uniref:P-type ATPase A domain-containing protein n=1 Tax=Tagetes erecta TaxID=13708 RepID=A0AAD8NQ99_TARER|nr:hypothetical protein QVD17_26612 [Tagetes erecta]